MKIQWTVRPMNMLGQREKILLFKNLELLFGNVTGIKLWYYNPSYYGGMASTRNSEWLKSHRKLLKHNEEVRAHFTLTLLLGIQYNTL